MDKPRGTWFWILIILIFVLYCIAWRRPFCATLDGQVIQQIPSQEVISSVPSAPVGNSAETSK